MPHGSNDSGYADDVRTRLGHRRTLRGHGEDGLQPRESNIPSHAILPAGASDIAPGSAPAPGYPSDDTRRSTDGEPSGTVRAGDYQHRAGRPSAAGRPGSTPVNHWHQDTHHYHYDASSQHASPQPQRPRQGPSARPAVAQLVAQPRLSRSGGCLVVLLVLGGTVLTLLVMLMGLALVGQILMLH